MPHIREYSFCLRVECSGRYKPHVWEFSRLNITHFVMSKRKLNQLCTSGDRRCVGAAAAFYLTRVVVHCRHR